METDSSIELAREKVKPDLFKSTMELEKVKSDLFNSVMRSEWENVEKIYKDHRACDMKITKSGDTALHVAVSFGTEDTVKRLVKLISSQHPEALKIKNERGNTALHLAASMGNVNMCKCIIEEDSSLAGFFNHDIESPLFLAALHGQKEVFLYLEGICKVFCQDTPYRRRNDGETILHCAINGEYFDLAFQIIDKHKELVNSADSRGFTPLHILATKPAAFKSGSNLGRWNKFIYHCIFVGDLKTKPRLEDEKDTSHQEKNQNCINSLRSLWNGAQKQPNTSDAEKGPKANTSDAEKGPKVTSNEGEKGKKSTQQTEGHRTTFIDFVKLVYKSSLIVLELGFTAIKNIRQQKEKHIWSVQIMNKLLERTSTYENTGANPQEPNHEEEETKPYEITDGGHVTRTCEASSSADSSKSNDKHKIDREMNSKVCNRKEGELVRATAEMEKTETAILIVAKNGVTETVEKILELFPELVRETAEMEKKETPILIAAKNGVVEMVEKILDYFPVAVQDVNADKKNIVLLAVEHRQPDVYQLLKDRNILKDSVFRQLDKDGNSALHLAAMLRGYKPWLVPGAAMQMQCEIKWFEFVKNSMPPDYFLPLNNDQKTPKELFFETHKDLVQAGSKWLTNTSQSCSVVAALIATVAFTSATTVLGGNIERSGRPTVENQPAFKMFSVSSLIALCFSVTSVVMFLAILTSRFQENDFGKDLPRKLLVGLTSLFVSIASMLISFCAGHFFVLGDGLQYAVFPIYIITYLPVSIFAVSQFPLYFDLLWATYKKIPKRHYTTAAL